MTTYHPLEEGYFSYVAVQVNSVEVKIGRQSVSMTLATAERIIDILSGYVEDHRRESDAYFELPENQDPSPEFKFWPWDKKESR